MGIDATTTWKEEGYQRDIQEEVNVDIQTKTLVDKKWTEYGFDSLI